MKQWLGEVSATVFFGFNSVSGFDNQGGFREVGVRGLRGFQDDLVGSGFGIDCDGDNAVACVEGIDHGIRRIAACWEFDEGIAPWGIPKLVEENHFLIRAGG